MAQMYTTTVKLMLLAMAFAAVSGAALAEDEAPAQGQGRFLANFDEQAQPITSRRHLTQIPLPNLCGPGTTDRCIARFSGIFVQPRCCPIGLGISACVDTGISERRCGSCTNTCATGLRCCNGRCVNPRSDPNNCGFCGRVCQGVPCTNFFCGY